MPFCSQVSANTQITIVTVFDIKRNSRGSEKKSYKYNENPSHTPPHPLPIRKWLLPNKIIVIGLGTKRHLVDVMPLLAHPLFISLNCVLYQIQ
jgi:hypothetical protein